MKKSINLMFAAFFLGLVVICFWYMAGRAGTVANIYKDGKIIHTINLDKVDTSYTLDIDGHNRVLVKNGAICMSDADCPDKLCVKQGEIFDASYPIVCLPNKVIIEIEGDFKYDSVTGK